MSDAQPYSLKRFEADVRSVVAGAAGERGIIDGVRPLFDRLMRVEGLVPAACRRPLPHKYGQYLLYRPDDDAFSVIAFAWGPGQASPVHDHTVWGLVGMYEGSVEEKRYRRTDDGSVPGRAAIEEVATVVCRPGEIGFVYPPAADIHSVANPTDSVAITVHVYGTDIGKRERHIYDVAAGTMRDAITRHDNEKEGPVHAA